MKKEFEIYQDNKGNAYTITTELEELLLKDIVKLHSIIEEVREYITRKDICIDTRKTDGSMDYVDLEKDLLEILDKEVN